MNHKEIASDYLVQARVRINTAKNVIVDDMFAYSIRQAQECVELSLKAAMRFIGVDFPKWHDVGGTLEKEINRFPESFRRHIPKLASISEKLAALREPAMYGDENLNLGPSALFNKTDTIEVLRDAEYCYNKVKKLFESF